MDSKDLRNIRTISEEVLQIEAASAEAGTGKYYDEKKPTAQQLANRAKREKIKSLTNQGKHKEASALHNEDAKYGYDKDGNSLNPVDIEKRKKKEDKLFGAPNVKEESQAKKEISDLKKAAKTLKGKYVAKADEVEEDKNWIQKAVKRPGAFTKKAKAHDKSVQAFAKYVDDNPNKFDTRTKRQANLAQTFASMKKEDMDEMIEILGEVLLEG